MSDKNKALVQVLTGLQLLGVTAEELAAAAKQVWSGTKLPPPKSAAEPAHEAGHGHQQPDHAAPADGDPITIGKAALEAALATFEKPYGFVQDARKFLASMPEDRTQAISGLRQQLQIIAKMAKNSKAFPIVQKGLEDMAAASSGTPTSTSGAGGKPHKDEIVVGH